MQTFRLPVTLLAPRAPLGVVLIGCGGSGSQMLTALARMHLALVSLGHAGLSVMAIDGDDVSPSNVGRQLFASSDIGQKKAIVLIHRLNLYFGLNWKAHPAYLKEGDQINGFRDASIVIGCVDSRNARRIIGEHLQFCSRDALYVDLGNAAWSGQVVIGGANNRSPLLTPMEIFPDLFDSQKEDRSTPSCSLAESLGSQSLFVNQMMVSWAGNLLFQSFRDGVLSYGGYFVNLKTGRTAPMPIKLRGNP